MFFFIYFTFCYLLFYLSDDYKDVLLAEISSLIVYFRITILIILISLHFNRFSKFFFYYISISLFDNKNFYLDL